MFGYFQTSVTICQAGIFEFVNWNRGAGGARTLEIGYGGYA